MSLCFYFCFCLSQLFSHHYVHLDICTSLLWPTCQKNCYTYNSQLRTCRGHDLIQYSWTCANWAFPYSSFALQVLLTQNFWGGDGTILEFYTRRKGIQFITSYWVFWVQDIKWRIVDKFFFFFGDKFLRATFSKYSRLYRTVIFIRLLSPCKCCWYRIFWKRWGRNFLTLH